MASLLDVFLAIGSAHAGEPLTREQLLERMKGHPDEETTVVAALFEHAGSRS